MSGEEPISKFRYVSRPSDWVFVFSCPTTWWRFKFAQSVGEFSHYFSDWADYKRKLLAPYRDLYDPLKQSFSLHTLHLPDVKALTRSFGRHSNLVLYAHCDRKTRRIELREGMVGYQALVSCIPQDFDGVIDLSACNPDGLPELIKSRAPMASIRATAANLDAVGWLHFYAHLFLQLGESECTYAEALLCTTHRFREAARSALVAN